MAGGRRGRLGVLAALATRRAISSAGADAPSRRPGRRPRQLKRRSLRVQPFGQPTFEGSSRSLAEHLRLPRPTRERHDRQEAGGQPQPQSGSTPQPRRDRPRVRAHSLTGTVRLDSPRGWTPIATRSPTSTTRSAPPAPAAAAAAAAAASSGSASGRPATTPAPCRPRHAQLGSTAAFLDWFDQTYPPDAESRRLRRPGLWTGPGPPPSSAGTGRSGEARCGRSPDP